MAEAQIKKVNWWHEAIFEWMISNPEASLRQCAEAFKVTQSWLSVIINSDVFKERFADRRDEHFSNVSRNVAEQVNGLASLSLDVLEERIERERDNIGLSMVKETAEMALKASGYIGPKPPAGREGNTYFLPGSVQVDKQTLEDARASMKQIEGVVTEIEKDVE